MNIKKTCPQCGDVFEGRSNQLYCNTTCKQRAFQAGQTTLDTPSPPVSKLAQHRSGFSHTRLPITRLVSNADIELEKLRLQQEEALRRLELEERKRERQYDKEKQERLFQQELEMATLKNQIAQQQREAERVILQEQLKAQEQTDKAKILLPDEADETPEESNIETGYVIAGMGVLGVLVGRWLASQTQKPAPPKA